MDARSFFITHTLLLNIYLFKAFFQNPVAEILIFSKAEKNLRALLHG